MSDKEPVQIIDKEMNGIFVEDDLMEVWAKYDDMVENTKLDKTDAVLEVLSLCIGWMKNKNWTEEEVSDIVTTTYTDWQTDAENEANAGVAIRMKEILAKTEESQLN